MTYSVLTEPVIPVIMPDGEENMLGIRETILNAHRIKDISGGNPLERYALLRLLIVFAMDMVHPKTSYERAELLQTGKFDDRILDAYISECEKEGPRFDLFDTDHPFLQSRYDEKLDAKAKKPVAEIFHALPNGNNHVFIDHRLADSHEVSIPSAFAALCASYVFCVSGLAGPSGVNNTPPLYTVMIGNNLFETIVINMLSEAEAAPLPFGAGDVPWRKDMIIKPRAQVAAVSLLEGLSWMPRRITLVCEDDKPFVRNVYCQAGLDFRGNDLWNDPHVPKFRKKDDTFGTVKPQMGREVWRDAGTLLYDHDSKQIRQPLVMRCLGNVYEEEELPDWMKIRASGLTTKKAAYIGWTEGELSIPSVLLYNQEMADVLRDDINLIEKVQAQIFSNVQRYYDKPRSNCKTEEHEVATQCQQHFLKGAHDLVFGEVINDLCSTEFSIATHNQRFLRSVESLISDTLTRVLHGTGNDTKSMIKQIEAEKWIWFNYQKIRKELEEQYVGA